MYIYIYIYHILYNYVYSKGGLTTSFIDNSLNSLIENREFSTSEVTERNESTDIASKIVLDNDFHRIRFNSLHKNVTNNTALRRTKSKQR